MNLDSAPLLDLKGLRQALRRANSFSRLPALIDLAWRCEWSDWLTVLGEEWTVCDNIGQFTDILLEETPFADVAESPLLYRHWLMDKGERDALNNLPETFTVWRGCYALNKWGLSWSLDRETAAAFPLKHRYQQDGKALLVKAMLRRDDVLAIKLDRKEAEVVAVRPKHVSTFHIR